MNTRFRSLCSEVLKMEGACDWQISRKEIKQRGAYLLQSGQWSDCSFLVGNEPNQVIIKGHKLLLAMSSPVFEAMFYSSLAEKNDHIPILDVQVEAFKALLEYIYTDNININSFDKACELCYGAKKYMLPHLVEECTKYLWSDLNPKNACRAYEFAKLFEEPVLMEKCMQIMCTQTIEVISETSFEDADINTVITLFKQEILSIKNEIDLFEAAMRYAKAQPNSSVEAHLDRNITEITLALHTDAEDSNNGANENIDVESLGDQSSAMEMNTGNTSCVSGVTNHSLPVDPASLPPSMSMDATMAAPPTASATNNSTVSTCATNVANSNTVSNAINSNGANNLPVSNATITSGPLRESSGCSTSGSRPTKPDENGVVPTLSIRNAIQKIRFLTLTPQQFADGPAKSSLLTQSEAFAILMNISSANCDVPMPEGFSTSTSLRRQTIVKPLGGFGQPGMRDCERMQPIVNIVSLGASIGLTGSLVTPCAPSSVVRREMRDPNKYYCRRPVAQQNPCYNMSVLDSSVTFSVDVSVCIIGIQVPTQVYEDEGDISSGGTGSSNMAPIVYSELLYAHLLDADGSRLTYTHCTSRVPYRSLLDITFNRPVYIQKHKMYKVGVVFNKAGWYPMGTCPMRTTCDTVLFTFRLGQPGDSVRDGLVRSIIFNY